MGDEWLAIEMKKVRLPCQVGANVSRVERGACRDIRVRDRARFHAERRDALGWNKREKSC